MATIYSNRNDNAGSHTVVNPNSTGTWAGGVVPATTDQVYVVGRRTQINQSSFGVWTSTRTITVDSTSYFASSGYFYTVTDQGSLIRVLYTGTTSTTFTGCTYDESAFGNFTSELLRWDGGNIYDNAYVINPAYILEIKSGQNFECNELIIQEGGYVFVHDGGTLTVNQGIILRDGFLVGRDTGTITITRNSSSLVNMGYLNCENYQLSIVDIEGGENRLYATTSSAITPGATYVDVTSVTNGSFAVGDEVAIYGYDDYRRRNVNYTGYRDASCSFKDMDEGFDVCGVAGSRIHLAMRNGARGDILAIATAGSQKVLSVDTSSSYFQAGDTVVINNVAYTIDTVEDSEHTLYTYDFTNSSTSLSDFWVDDSTHVYSSGWEIESGVGLRNTSGAYRELVHKTCWRRDIRVEAEMSPLSAYDSGTRGTSDYGILTSYDPSFRWGHRGYDSFKTDYFRIDDAEDDIAFYIRSASNYTNNKLSRNGGSLQTQTRLPATYVVDNRKGFTQVYVNGDLLTKEFRRDGSYKGLPGIYTDANTNMRCKSLTIKAPIQKVYLTTTDSFTVGHIVYRSGAEHNHPSGSRVVKLASTNTGSGSHVDLAFAYRGQRGNGEWPLCIQVNGSNNTNSSMPYTHNHDMNPDYYYDLGNSTSARSMTYDLGSEKTFTHVSFRPRINDYSEFYGFNGVAIYGSNDLSSWTTLYGPTNDTKKWYYATYHRCAYYPTGTVSYRYVKFETKGAQQGTYATNRYVNIGVHNFSSGYSIVLNNASDFSVGDTITILTDNGFSWASREYEGYKAHISSTDPETYYHGGWKTECTITSKSGNTIYLDRPIWWGYVEDTDSISVVKTNRNFKIQGTFDNSGSTNDWRWPNIYLYGGSSYARKYLFRQIRLENIGSYRYSSSSDYTRGFRNYSYDYWNAVNQDGCVMPFGCDGATYNGLLSYSAHMIARNGVYMNMRSFNFRYNVSYTGNAAFNNKFLGVIHFYCQDVENFAINYNEFAGGEYGVYLSSMRVDRMVSPHLSEIRRNFIRGTSYSGIGLYDETVGPRRIPRIRIENNKIRGTDDYAWVGRVFGGSPIVEFDAFSEHTGSRLSRYRNEGFVGQGDTSSDLSYANQIQNYGRYGYDVCFGVYHILVRHDDSPDILEIYNPQGDDYFACLGMELDVRGDVDFQVHVKFDYKYSQLKRIQDDGAADGQLRCYAIQHGTIISTQWSEVPGNMNDGWYTFEYTFTQFAAEDGKAAVYLAFDAQNSFIKIRNSNAIVLTDNPDKIYVIGNSFNLNRVWDQYHERKDTRILTPANNKTVKVRRLKF